MASERGRIDQGGVSEEQQREGMVAALLRERDSYLTHGKKDRAAEVDKQLAAYGHKEPKTEAPKGRRSAPKQTAADSAPKQTAAESD